MQRLCDFQALLKRRWHPTTLNVAMLICWMLKLPLLMLCCCCAETLFRCAHPDVVYAICRYSGIWKILIIRTIGAEIEPPTLHSLICIPSANWATAAFVKIVLCIFWHTYWGPQVLRLSVFTLWPHYTIFPIEQLRTRPPVATNRKCLQPLVTHWSWNAKCSVSLFYSVWCETPISLNSNHYSFCLNIEPASRVSGVLAVL